MLAQLAAAYEAIIAERKLAAAEAERLRSVAADMRWYADLMGAEQWQELPSLNEWSFSQHLWHLMKAAEGIVGVDTAVSPHRLIHHAKEHIGFIAGSLNALAVD
jgi:hypothetical protein